MKRMVMFVLALVLMMMVVGMCGNTVMAQTAALAGWEPSRVLAVEWAGDESYVELWGERHYFDGVLAENVIYQIKSTVQSTVEGVKYAIEHF